MLEINKITASPRQQQTLVLDDGTAFTFTMYYVPLQQGWFITELTYLTFTLRGLRICNSPNLLYQWGNKLGWGLACSTTGNREPSLQQDFLSGASRLYVLTQAEVTYYEQYIKNG